MNIYTILVCMSFCIYSNSFRPIFHNSYVSNKRFIQKSDTPNCKKNNIVMRFSANSLEITNSTNSTNTSNIPSEYDYLFGQFF